MGQIYEKKGVAGKILGTKELRGRRQLEATIAGKGWGHFGVFLLGIIMIINISYSKVKKIMRESWGGVPKWE
jgi:hypothetical protein